MPTRSGENGGRGASGSAGGQIKGGADRKLYSQVLSLKRSRVIIILKQAGLEEVEEDIVELENLMRVNFLVVADEVELLVAADEEEQDSEK